MSQENTVYTKLRMLLLDGAFPPGQRLTEQYLCDLLAVSRTPVRAALTRLAAQKLVIGENNRGYSVRLITVGDVWDANVVRATLEGLAAQAAASRPLDNSHRQALEQSLDLYAALSDAIEPTDAFLTRHTRANRLFHDTLVAASGNASLDHALEALAYMPVQINRSVFFGDPDYAHQTIRSGLAEHRGVLGAILVGDATAAEMLMRSHSQKALRGIERIRATGEFGPDDRALPFHELIGAPPKRRGPNPEEDHPCLKPQAPNSGKT